MIKPYIHYIIYTTLNKAEFDAINFDDIIKSNPSINIKFYDAENVDQVLTFLNEDPLASILSDNKPELLAASRKATSAILFTGSYPKADVSQLNELHTDISAIMLSESMISVLDLLTMNFYSGAEWCQLQEHIMVSADFSKNVMMFCSPLSDSGQEVWLYTRGMLKFGLPDLSLQSISNDNINLYYDAMTMLINDLANKTQTLTEELQSKSDLQVSFINSETKKPMAVIKFEGVFTGSKDDPDFNNFHLALEVKDIDIDDEHQV